MSSIVEKLGDMGRLIRLVILLQLGRRYWLFLLLLLSWPLIQCVRLIIGWQIDGINAVSAQNLLIGLPLYCLAIGVGNRIIANEIEQRTLEVSYTIPGGSRRVWLAKLISIVLFLLTAEILIASVCWLFLTHFPLMSLYTIFQGSVFFLVLAMFFGAVAKNELAAILLSTIVGYFCFEHSDSRWSPLFNPQLIENISATELLTWSIQNHLGYALLSVAISALSFYRAEKREVLLAS